MASLHRLLQPEPAALDVELRVVPATTVAAVDDDVDRDDVLDWYAGAMAELDAVVPVRAGSPGGLYDNALFQTGRGHLLVYRPTADPPHIGRVHPVTLPPVELAVTTHVGEHDDIDVTYGQLGTWVVDNVLAVDGPVRETYLTGPRDTDEPTAWRTEIGWPVFRVGTRLSMRSEFCNRGARLTALHHAPPHAAQELSPLGGRNVCPSNLVTRARPRASSRAARASRLVATRDLLALSPTLVTRPDTNRDRRMRCHRVPELTCSNLARMEQTSGVRTDKSRASIVRSIQDKLRAREEIRAVLPFTQTSKRPRMPGQARRDRVLTGIYQSARRYRPLVITSQRLFVLDGGRGAVPRGILADFPRDQIGVGEVTPVSYWTVRFTLDLPGLGLVPFEAGRKEHDEALKVRELLGVA